jgi:putative sterol carrier protein
VSGRAVPPHDISPAEFFSRWVPHAATRDPDRQQRVAGVRAAIQFELIGDDGGHFYVEIAEGMVSGAAGRLLAPDLHLRLEVATWRRLNAGELNAARAAASGLLKFEGSFYLALKLHFILG